MSPATTAAIALLCTSVATAVVGCAGNAGDAVGTTSQLHEQAALTTCADAVANASDKHQLALAKTRAAKLADAKRQVVINAVGDCAIGDLQHGAGAPGSFAARLRDQPDPMGYPFSGIAELFAKDDLTIANLEGVLTTSKAYRNPVFSIRGLPEYANMLVRGGVELVNLDNNHSDDYGVTGLADTKQALDAAKVGYFGKGRVDSRVIDGVRITNLGYLGGRADIEARMRREVAAARAQGGIVIASFHWGIEGFYAIHPIQRKLGRAAIDAGADLVLGHHPHVLQGVERYRERNIVYSLGNFVFGANSQPKDTDSMIAQSTFTLKGGAVVARELSLIPVRITSDVKQNDFRPIVLTGDEGQRVLAKVARMSEALNTQPVARGGG